MTRVWWTVYAIISAGVLMACAPGDGEISLPGEADGITQGSVNAGPAASTSDGLYPFVEQLRPFSSVGQGALTAVATLPSTIASGENYVELWQEPPGGPLIGLPAWINTLSERAEPFSNISALQFQSLRDGRGVLYWQARRIASGQLCVLALRRSQDVQPGSFAVLRNCGAGDVNRLLSPLRAS